MIRAGLALLALACAAPLAAQGVVNPPATATDQAARDAAAAAQAKADAAASSASVTSAMAAMQAAIPSPCSTTPMPDTLTGSVGTGTPCSVRPDNTRPTVIQAKTTTTASDASYSVTFDAAFASVPIYADARVYGQAVPYLCTVQTLTTTGASGKCYQLVTTTLPGLATSLLNLVVSPFITAGAGVSVRVVARQ